MRRARDSHLIRIRKGLPRSATRIRLIEMLDRQQAALGYLARIAAKQTSQQTVNRGQDLDNKGRILELRSILTLIQDQFQLHRTILYLRQLSPRKKKKKALEFTFQLHSRAKRLKNPTSCSLRFKPCFSERIQLL